MWPGHGELTLTKQAESLAIADLQQPPVEKVSEFCENVHQIGCGKTR
jgi:hypothetical protein